MVSSEFVCILMIFQIKILLIYSLLYFQLIFERPGSQRSHYIIIVALNVSLFLTFNTIWGCLAGLITVLYTLLVWFGRSVIFLCCISVVLGWFKLIRVWLSVRVGKTFMYSTEQSFCLNFRLRYENYWGNDTKIGPHD